jgi:hypothetical protein
LLRTFSSAELLLNTTNTPFPNPPQLPSLLFLLFCFLSHSLNQTIHFVFPFL